MRTLDADEAQRLLRAAVGTRLYEVVLLGLATGMRRGEILGLQWKDIDFDRKRVMVRRSLQPDGTLSEPKTARSRRDIGLAKTAIDALRQHKARQNELRLTLGEAYTDRGFVFADATGRAWVPDGISTLYRSIVKRAGFQNFRFHDMRHTAASLMLARGVPITTVAAILGHANTSTTLSLYAHAIKGSEQAGADAMDDILKGA